MSRVRDLGDRARTGAKVAQQTGLLWNMSLPGARALGKVFTSGSRNPAQIYRVHAANGPHRPAILYRDQVITFGELDRRIDGLAHGLVSRGIGRGGSFVLFMRNRPEFVELTFAGSRVGAAAVSASWRSTSAELEYLVNHSGAQALFFEADLYESVVRPALPNLSETVKKNLYVVNDRVRGAEPLAALRKERDEPFRTGKEADEDAAVVIYTSGTTGKPKGAVRKFSKDTIPAAFRFLSETPLRTDDFHLVTCPLYHSTAIGFLSLTHLLGAACVLMEEFKPETFLELVERHRITTTACVPTMLHRVLSLDAKVLDRYETRSLRGVFCLGAPLSGVLANEFMDRFGDIVFNVYGATETGIVTVAVPEDLRQAPNTIGKVLAGNDVRLFDDEGREVPDGAVGELYVKSGLLVAGYHKDAAATAGSMRDGYFSVGDLARRDPNGRYFLEGRKRDMIISGGVNVYPAEVEAALELHPAVAEVAVVGVEDPDWGEKVRAFVVKRAGMDVDEGALKGFARERLSGAKVPRDVVFLDVLPRNPTGKVLKRELREWTV